jgi:Flp pilus assembly protein TadG
MNISLFRLNNKQKGAAAVEFALISSLLFSIVFGVIEMGRVMFYVNTVGEATALGARMAIVCGLNDADIKKRMRAVLPILDNDNKINITYQQLAACSATLNNNCCPSGATDCVTSVTVEIADGVVIKTFIPYIAFPVTLPKSRTQLRRESMNDFGGTNPMCN